jgi:hypothetical protein
MGPKTGLDVVTKRKILPILGLELRPLGRPARSQSLYECAIPARMLALFSQLVSDDL